jgi:DNA-binding FadR family transcriptional regulator
LLLDRKVANDLVETRLLLESHTTFLAVRRATTDDLTAMERAIQGMEEAVSDSKRYLEHDLRFHLRIAQATQGTILGNLLSTIRDYLQSWVEQTLATSPPQHPTFRATLSITQHKKILRALKKRRANAARSAMREKPSLAKNRRSLEMLAPSLWKSVRTPVRRPKRRASGHAHPDTITTRQPKQAPKHL